MKSFISELLTVSSFPMTSKWLSSSFDSTDPKLGILIALQLFITMGKKSFSNSLQVVFKEVNYVEKPAHVDILLPFSYEDRLADGNCVCLKLRDVKVGDLVVAVI